MESGPWLRPHEVPNELAGLTVIMESVAIHLDDIWFAA